MSSLTFGTTDPSPVTRPGPGARVSRDGGRRGGDGDGSPGRRREDRQPAADLEQETAEAAHSLDVIADEATIQDRSEPAAPGRIDLTA